ncbi:uncharacterized protein LOC116294655 isoform X2 [Actinia tenebrosa]|uniref:Uncharacterized protein LOC116294655 isoform X2 n=1 Tax=Actinia tenebrosa TaxID=6105 RepID=A0A6P8HZP8_ACTTE|nr:uncharacterized protein LOC116294655 isoform X2 [Actinia tenebrosa]
MMEERDKEVIRRMYVRLERNLEATKLMGYLYQEHVFNEDDMDKIRIKSTSKKKAEKLLKILKKRKNGLKMLIKALLVTEIQAFLGHELLERVTWSEQELENFNLELEGKVDPCQLLQANLVVLKHKNDELMSKLSEYQSKFNLLEEEKVVLQKQCAQEKKQPSSDVMVGSQLFQKLRRSRRLWKPDLNKETRAVDETLKAQSEVKTDQGCQKTTSLTAGDLPAASVNAIHDDLGINWTDVGRRWSDSVYDRRPKSRANRRRSFNDSIGRSSTSLKNTILGIFGKRHGIVEHKTADQCSTESLSNTSDDCCDTCSNSTDLTILA